MKYGLGLSVLCSFVFLSCGGTSEREKAINIKWNGSKSALQSDSRIYSDTENIVLPTSARNFDCLFVNITGPDIPSKNPKVSPNLFLQMKNGGACSYPGIISKPLKLETGKDFDFTMNLPVGGERLIQIGGMININGGDCSTLDFNNPSIYEESNARSFMVFELGRTLVTDLFGPKVLTIPNGYNSMQPRRMDCEKAPSETGTITNIEDVVAGIWKGPCNSATDANAVYPNLSTNGVLSQQIIVEFAAGAYRVDVGNYSDSTCTSANIHSKISYRNIVPTFVSTANPGDFDLNLMSGTVFAKYIGTPALVQLNNICGVSISGAPNTDIDVTGLGGACKLASSNQQDFEKLRVTANGIMFGLSLPAGGNARPSAINTGKTYVR